MAAVDYVVTVSHDGRVRIPVAARARWQVNRVVVVDLGDRVVIRPALPDPVAALRGKYAGQGPAADMARRRERSTEPVEA